MKHSTRFLIGLISILLTLSLVSCGGADMAPNNKGEAEDGGANNIYPPAADRDEAEIFEEMEQSQPNLSDDPDVLWENPFLSASEHPVSTFSADVDTASYTYFRKLINNGYNLNSLKSFAPFRTEEMINYFDYDYELPAEGEVFGVGAQIAPCPWNAEAQLMMLGLTTEEITEKGANNLVFLIDVSGSMSSEDKLPLLKKAFTTLVESLDEQDTVSIVTYSGKESTVLSGCPGNEREQILSAINSLVAYGSTNGESGLVRAYSLAADYFIEGGNNRIIMASDGDLNVGISSAEELKSFVETKRDNGIYLSVLGFGTGNYNDANMSALAENGNGVYYYIDGETEARKVLGDELLSTLYTVAKDVKLQITFDPAYVSQYRLVGYESRMLNQEDFEDDTKDAGDVGAGHMLTVCYELIPTEDAAKTSEGDAQAWMKLAIRYKLPDATESILREHLIGSAHLSAEPTGDFRFVCAVISTAMILNQSRYNKAGVTLEDVCADLRQMEGLSEEQREFLSLVQRL